MTEAVETGRITTDIPARMDRLPWALVEAFLGVKAEGQSLESIAKPLTAEQDVDGEQRRTPQPA